MQDQMKWLGNQFNHDNTCLGVFSLEACAIYSVIDGKLESQNVVFRSVNVISIFFGTLKVHQQGSTGEDNMLEKFIVLKCMHF